MDSDVEIVSVRLAKPSASKSQATAAPAPPAAPAAPRPRQPAHLRTPQRINGVDLKAAEQTTRRLLLCKEILPVYHYMPTPSNLSPSAERFLWGPGFASLPPSLDPASRGSAQRGRPYGVPPARAARKRAQVANLVAAVLVALPPPTSGRPAILLDLCGGCGHVGLVLAAVLPHVRVTVVDTKPVALGVARRRAEEARLTNIDTLQCDITELADVRFDAAVALHACGGATDTVLATAARAGASVVVASCCVGGIVAEKGSVTGRASQACVADPAGGDGAVIDWTRPRSGMFRGVLQGEEFARLARAADFGEQLSDRDDWRRVAKALLEQDRVFWMGEMGYQVRMVKMRPLDCTPKNDILVAWPRRSGGTRGVEWDLDEETNNFFKDVRDGSVLKGLGAEEVADVEQILLAEVCADSSMGAYTFPTGLGKRKRKVIHAVADSLGLWHESFGKGSERTVSVRRTSFWPLFFDYYVGCGGPAIEELCDALADKVPRKYKDRRALLRGNPRHVTIIRPTEISLLPYNYKGDKAVLLTEMTNALRRSRVRVLGLGRVADHPHIDADNGDSEEEDTGGQSSDSVAVNEAYFIVLEWPAAAAFRRAHGLPELDFHVTLGFRQKDIHGVAKGRTTLVFNHEVEFSPL